MLDPILEAVPERMYEGTRFILVEDVPLPYRAAFDAWMVGQTCMEVSGTGWAVYAWDWERWKNLRFRE